MNCTNYSYAKRGFACSPVTAALTSNTKFIAPCSNVYYQPITHMLQYPGYSGDFITTIGDAQHPEKIKTYFGKTYDKSDNNNGKEIHPSSPDPIEKSCPNCHLLRHNA